MDLSYEEECILSDAEEQWANFLSKFNHKEIKLEDAEKEFNNLIRQIEEDYENKCLIRNPFYYIKIANDILIDQNKFYKYSSGKKTEKALDFFSKRQFS